MNLKNISLEDFLNQDPNSEDSDVLAIIDDVLIGFEHEVGSPIRELDDEYELRNLGADKSGNIALMSNGVLVGIYSEAYLGISSTHTNKQLGIPMILEAVKNRPPPGPRILSKRGKRVMTKAWEVARGERRDPWPE